MPLYITNAPRYLDTVSIKISPENTTNTLSLLREKWKEIDPYRPFEYSFLDETFDSQYRPDERLSKIFASFTTFAIFIACLGLFGLASFLSEQRTKEIGIRKILGASVPGIIMLLWRQFGKLILIGNIIAIPLAYYILHKWLQNFHYRISIGVEIFLLSTIMIAAIAVLSISYQSIKAALANPIDSLRYE